MDMTSNKQFYNEYVLLRAEFLRVPRHRDIAEQLMLANLTGWNWLEITSQFAQAFATWLIEKLSAGFAGTSPELLVEVINTEGADGALVFYARHGICGRRLHMLFRLHGLGPEMLALADVMSTGCYNMAAVRSNLLRVPGKAVSLLDDTIVFLGRPSGRQYQEYCRAQAESFARRFEES